MHIPKASLAIFIILPLTSCGATDSSPPSNSEAIHSLYDELEQRSKSISSISVAETIKDYLPAQMVSYQGLPPTPLAMGVAVGDIKTAKVTSAGRIVPPGEADQGEREQEVPTSSFQADWRVITASMSVARGWLSQESATKTVKFVIPTSGEADPDVVIQGLEALDNAIVVLAEADDKYGGAFRVARESTAVGQVDPNGNVNFPAMGAEATYFLGGVDTLNEIAEEARKEQPLIEVGDDGLPGRG